VLTPQVQEETVLTGLSTGDAVDLAEDTVGVDLVTALDAGKPETGRVVDVRPWLDWFGLLETTSMTCRGR